MPTRWDIYYMRECEMHWPKIRSISLEWDPLKLPTLSAKLIEKVFKQLFWWSLPRSTSLPTLCSCTDNNMLHGGTGELLSDCTGFEFVRKN